ncbi:MAG TPA: zf-HC2 domain-containing protein [Longimicrobiales bacterium]|nr:zf-HC2 domain-containing protein [Longimicrobiales bacterium]
MNERIPSQHPGAEEIQALLEGDLPAGESARLEEHLASCGRCAAELEGWRIVFRELAELPPLAPSAAFGDRVLAGVTLPEPRSLAARVRSLLGVPERGRHLAGDRLQDFVDGLLPARQAAGVQAHLDSCPVCAADTEAWRTTFARLGDLDRLSPDRGFADRVMAHVRVPAPTPERAPEWRRALGWARGLVPRTRRAWAAISGVAVTPAVTLGLVIWTLASHPTLTAGALASFVWWKASALAAVAWEALAAYAVQSAGLFEVFSFVGSLAWSRSALAGALVALSLGTVTATWVLYRNLFTPRSGDGRVAHASHS